MKGEIVREILNDKKIQQKDIAAKLGLSPSNLGNQLQKDDIRTGLLEKIAEASGISLAEFYGAATFGTMSSESGDTRAMLELLKMKDEQLTISMTHTRTAQEQTSKALEQMDRIIDILQKPDKTGVIVETSQHIPAVHARRVLAQTQDLVTVSKSARRRAHLMAVQKKKADKPEIG